jgi:hypothetical protein
MTWSNLLSGFIGGLVGGLLSIVAAFMTIRHERSQARQDRAQVREDASRRACNVIKQDILAINNALSTIFDSNDSSESRIYALLEEIHAPAQRILYLYNVQIANEKLRSRISRFTYMVVEWYTNARESPTTVKQEPAKAIESYAGYVLKSIEDYLGDKPLTPDESAPDLPATENA